MRERIYAYTCDGCKRKIPEDDVCTISGVYDRAMDAAGSMDDETASIDLCAKCAQKTIEALRQNGFNGETSIPERRFRTRQLLRFAGMKGLF